MRGFELIPRYSAGSPAMVHDRELADRVAKDEKRGYEAALEGVYGAEAMAEAKDKGLDGIVLERTGDYRFLDLITGTEYVDVLYGAIRYPEKLYVWAKGAKEIYFFHRKVLLVCKPSKTPDSNMMPVFNQLRSEYQIDPYSREAMDLWSQRQHWRHG